MKKKRTILKELTAKVGYYLPLTYNCAQTSFAALRDVFDLGDGDIFRGLTVFPALAGRGETCGAVTGCLFVIGLAYGSREEDIGKKGLRSPAWPNARRFCDRFVRQYTSTQCSEIVLHMLGSAASEDGEERKRWVERRDEKCTILVQDAVRITAEMLLQDPSFSA